MNKVIEIIPTVYDKNDITTGFEYLIKTETRTLFLFNDDEESHFTTSKGNGTAVVRPFNIVKYKQNKRLLPLSAGIITGTRKNGGYQNLEEHKSKIDDCFIVICEILLTGNYNKVRYSCNEEGLIGTSNFKVSRDVIEYITKSIWNLSFLVPDGRSLEV